MYDRIIILIDIKKRTSNMRERSLKIKRKSYNETLDIKNKRREKKMFTLYKSGENSSNPYSLLSLFESRPLLPARSFESSWSPLLWLACRWLLRRLFLRDWFVLLPFESMTCFPFVDIFIYISLHCILDETNKEKMKKMNFTRRRCKNI